MVLLELRLVKQIALNSCPVHDVYKVLPPKGVKPTTSTQEGMSRDRHCDTVTQNSDYSLVSKKRTVIPFSFACCIGPVPLSLYIYAYVYIGPQGMNIPETNSPSSGYTTIKPGQKSMEVTETSHHRTRTFSQRCLAIPKKIMGITLKRMKSMSPLTSCLFSYQNR